MAAGLAALIVAGCGGGGSGSSSRNPAAPSGGSSDTTSNVPENPPPAQQAVYSGESGLALITELNASALTSDAYVGVNTIVELGYEYPPLPGQALYQVQQGPAGGKAVVEGRPYDNGGGWISIDYQQYQYKADNGDVYTYDGQVQFIYPADYSSTSRDVVIDLSPLTMTGPNTDLKIAGSITAKYITTKDNAHVPDYVANLVQTDNILHASIKLADYEVVGSQHLSVSGRIYDSRVGYVDVTVQTPLHVTKEDGSTPPVGGGPLLLQGAGDARASIAFLTPAFASVDYDGDGDGSIDEAFRLDWTADNIFGAPTSSGGPQADAMLPTPVSVGQPVQLEGRFSHSADGTFVHFNWTVALAPAGGAAELADAHSATPTMTVDEAGDYLIKLDVSNRVGSSSDAIIVHAGPTQNSTATYDDPDTGMSAGPDRSARLDQVVTLDGRGSVFENNGGDYGHKWTLYAPPGSYAVLNDTSVMQPTFTPDVSGIYYAIISHHSYKTYETHSAWAAIGVGTHTHFDFRTTLADDANWFTLADFDNDGDPDILYNAFWSQDTSLIYNEGGGRFSAPVPVDVTQWRTVADLDGDGRLDLVRADTGGIISYRLQQADGTFAPAASVTIGWPCYYPSGLAVAPLAGATRNSLIIGGCTNDSNHVAIAIFPPQPDGVLGAPRLMAINTLSPYSIIVADVTGDGVADLVYAEDPQFQDKTLTVMPGRIDGSFGSAVTYATAAPVSRIAAADINGDGLLDVVLSGSIAQVMYQQPDGTLGAGVAFTKLANSAVVGDVNGDGRPDLVGIGEFDDQVSSDARSEFGLFLQQADGSFADELAYPTYTLSGGGGNVRIADINADGIADLIYVANGALQIMLGDPLDSGTQAVTVESIGTTNHEAPRRLPMIGVGFRQAAVQPLGDAFRSGGA
ncbi:MAG TPA: FG-GAP-like repeat-containing protein [Gammaproteobacteria bacterium]|nr:FG-GAP-like repeat-containing protein [Gammaproteobacteria bacterium]